jgi:MoaA/NifB/PqqE/SkfB family radical SAM enzyme
VPFGFIFTLTQFNLHELDWVTRFAVEAGARLLQIHPLEAAGRAVRALPAADPDELEAGVAFLEVARLQQQYRESIRLQLDLFDRRVAAADPECVLAAPLVDAYRHTLAELVSPLIVEPDGFVVPIHFGLDRQVALGNLHEAPLRVLAADWRREKLDAFLTICRRAFVQLMEPAELPFVNWYAMLAAQSGNSGATPRLCRRLS